LRYTNTFLRHFYDTIFFYLKNIFFPCKMSLYIWFFTKTCLNLFVEFLFLFSEVCSCYWTWESVNKTVFLCLQHFNLYLWASSVKESLWKSLTQRQKKTFFWMNWTAMRQRVRARVYFMFLNKKWLNIIQSTSFGHFKIIN